MIETARLFGLAPCKSCYLTCVSSLNPGLR